MSTRSWWAAACLLGLSCGGIAQREGDGAGGASPMPQPSPAPTATASAPDADAPMPGPGAGMSWDGGTLLPECVPGFAQSDDPVRPCNWLVRGLCFEDKLEACSCACP